MRAQEFIAKWSAHSAANELNERAGAQTHFIDLCQLLGVPTPADPDHYCFERGVARTGAGKAVAVQRVNGFADVWLRGHFAWEYKAPGRSLDAALAQLMMYALPLDNPPLLVVSDRLRIEVHTHFTGTPSEQHVFALEDLARDDVRRRLATLWTAPDSWRPRRTNRDITEEAARTFAGTAQRLHDAGVTPTVASHFLTQCLFCFFAEDVGLLPAKLFERLVGVQIDPAAMRTHLGRLFETMRDGGLFGVDPVSWFNGGLFKTIAVPPLTTDDVAALKAASALDWSAVDPSILGTLFERGLDPAKRSQLGAHYTDPATILRLVEPVVQRPLLAEWAQAKAAITTLLERRDSLRAEAELIPSTSKALKDKYARVRSRANEAERAAQTQFGQFLERLRNYRVLDPACGSGNFLYLALKALKDIEHQVNLEAEALGLDRQQDLTGPHNVLGIELNEYAAELARVTVWIGELQWRIQRGYAFKTHPVLEPLDHIECRDAVLNSDGGEAPWPVADAVVGNPPFVGDKKMRGELGDAYTEALRAAYKGRVPGGADLVCYWFEKARGQIEAGSLTQAGLVATNSIRQTTNRKVLQRILTSTRIYEAWGDEPWVNEGADVNVSLVCFGTSTQATRFDGDLVSEIYANLKAKKIGEVVSDLTLAGPLRANDDTSFFGLCLAGPFAIRGSVARSWLSQPNPNSRPNSDVVRPIWGGKDLTDRQEDWWVVDFGAEISEVDASLYEEPFNYIQEHVRPTRIANNRPSRARWWFRHGETRPGMRKAIAQLTRSIVTVERAKHRFFCWLPSAIAAEHRLVVIARSDDSTFGVLSSRIHVAWAISQGSTLVDRPGYNTKVCFQNFPFPEGLTPADTGHQRTEALPDGALVPAEIPAELRPHIEAIASAARRLNDLRVAWLNPPEWTERVPEVVPLGMSHSPYPDRIVAKPGFEQDLAKRTLTNLYNLRPAWLAQAHEALDAAVAAAYGWADYTPAMADDELLQRLLALNLARAGSPAP